MGHFLQFVEFRPLFDQIVADVQNLEFLTDRYALQLVYKIVRNP